MIVVNGTPMPPGNYTADARDAVDLDLCIIALGCAIGVFKLIGDDESFVSRVRRGGLDANERLELVALADAAVKALNNATVGGYWLVDDGHLMLITNKQQRRKGLR